MNYELCLDKTGASSQSNSVQPGQPGDHTSGDMGMSMLVKILLGVFAGIILVLAMALTIYFLRHRRLQVTLPGPV